MKKLSLILLIGALLIASGVSAQEEEAAADPGLTPDSPVYFLDDFWKSVRLTFAFNAERKADLRLRFAEEKLAEAEKMAQENKEEHVERALQRYEEQVEDAQTRAETANEERRAAILEKVAEATSKHFAVLERVKDQVPERAKEALERAREVSEKGNIEALQALAEKHTERAAEVAARVIERRAELAEKLAERRDDTAAKEAERLEHFAKVAEEISSRADIDITDEATRARIKAKLEAGTNQADITLRRVLEQVPLEARPAIERALQNIQRVERPRALQEIKFEVDALNKEQRIKLEELRQERQEVKTETREERKVETQETRPQLFEQIKLEERLPIKRPEPINIAPERIEVKTNEESQVIKEESLRIGY